MTYETGPDALLDRSAPAECLAIDVPNIDRPNPGRPVRLLTFSTLFPHQGRPNHGVFVENRLRHLLATGQASSTVIAPVPWFPSRSPRFGEWAQHAGAGRLERRGALNVHHPRYLVPPKIGMLSAPASLFAAGALTLRRLIRQGAAFDLIDGHYIYPDGVAAVALGRAFGLPVLLTARGSDITQYPDYAAPRRMVQWAMHHAAALISVSGGLKNAMVALGAPPEKVTILRNGVDLEMFRPQDPAPIRAEFGAEGPVLLSVGHLIERKRHHLAIEALRDLPGWTLAIVGQGPERDRLQSTAVSHGVADRVRFCGAQPHDRLAQYYSAADILILASSREGWANVLLEAMACGTRVVASNIPGNPEIVRSPEAGEVVTENSAGCFAEVIRRLQSRPVPQKATRAYAEQFSWDATSLGQIEIFRRAIQAAGRP